MVVRYTTQKVNPPFTKLLLRPNCIVKPRSHARNTSSNLSATKYGSPSIRLIQNSRIMHYVKLSMLARCQFHFRVKQMFFYVFQFVYFGRWDSTHNPHCPHALHPVPIGGRTLVNSFRPTNNKSSKMGQSIVSFKKIPKRWYTSKYVSL